MASGSIWFQPIQVASDTNNDPLGAAKAYFYLANSSTLATIYTDINLLIPASNPVIADVSGRWAEIYLTPGSVYKVDLKTSAGVSLDGYPADYQPAIPSSSGSTDVPGVAGEALTAGLAVYLSDGSGSKTAGTWYKADSANTYSSTGATDVGMTLAAIASGATGTIRMTGQVTGLSSLTVGTDYWIGTSGALTATQPSNGRLLGRADSTSSLVLGGSGSSLVSGGFDLIQLETFL